MVSDTQAVPTLFIYCPWHIDLMVAESLLSSGLLKHVPVNKKEGRKKKKGRRKGREMTYPIPLRKHSRRPPGLSNPQLEFSPRPHLTAMETGEGKLLNHWDQCGLFYYFRSRKIYKREWRQLLKSVSEYVFWTRLTEFSRRLPLIRAFGFSQFYPSPNSLHNHPHPTERDQGEDIKRQRKCFPFPVTTPTLFLGGKKSFCDNKTNFLCITSLRNAGFHGHLRV